MLERSKLESLEVEIIKTKWLFGFVCEMTLNLIVNGETFTIEKRAMDMQFKKPEKEIKREFLKGKKISCLYNEKNVKLQYKDNYVHVLNE